MTPLSSAAYLGSNCQLAFSYVSCVKVSCRPFTYEVTTGFMGSYQQQVLENTFSGTDILDLYFDSSFAWSYSRVSLAPCSTGLFGFICSYVLVQNRDILKEMYGIWTV